MLVAREVPGERLGVSRLDAVVELLADRPREFVDEPARIDEVECPDALLREAGGLVEKREVGLDLPAGLGPLHLDGDRPAVRERGPVDLADRRGGQRLLLELEEEPPQRQVEIFLDHPLHVLERERPDVVLQAAQLADDVRREEIRPHREQLAELHEGRAEIVEQLAEVAAALGGLAVERDRVLARHEVGQLVRGEEVAEPVPDRGLRNLGNPPDRPRGRGRHPLSVAR